MLSLNLKKGDELITKYKNVRIKLIEDPYFKENNVFFDSMNYNKNSLAYGKRDNSYSRSNSIYIFPIEVTSSNQKSTSWKILNICKSFIQYLDEFHFLIGG